MGKAITAIVIGLLVPAAAIADSVTIDNVFVGKGAKAVFASGGLCHFFAG